MNVTFALWGMTFAAEVDYTPYVPARLSGPPENCYPEEGGYAEITDLRCGKDDASFLIGSDMADELNEAAYEACVAHIDYQRQEYEESRAADAAYDRR